MPVLYFEDFPVGRVGRFDATYLLTEDEIQALRFRISQKKFLLRDPALQSHPALAGLYTDEFVR